MPETGDSPRTEDMGVEEYREDRDAPTAGDLRAAGYEVPEGVDDDETPGTYAADTPLTEGVKEYRDEDEHATPRTAKKAIRHSPENK